MQAMLCFTMCIDVAQFTISLLTFNESIKIHNCKGVFKKVVSTVSVIFWVHKIIFSYKSVKAKSGLIWLIISNIVKPRQRV